RAFDTAFFEFFKKKRNMLLELESDTLQEVINDNDTVIVQYSASWCGNCRIMKPKFKKLASETEGVKFVIVDAEKFPESRKLGNVNNLTTFTAFKRGNFANQVQSNKVYRLIDLLNEITSN